MESSKTCRVGRRRARGRDRGEGTEKTNEFGAIFALMNVILSIKPHFTAIHDMLEALNAETGWDVPIHVDAASGGFIGR